MSKRVKYVNENLSEVVSSTINEHLKLTLIEALEKDQASLAKLLESPVEKFHQIAFNESLNVFMNLNNLPKVDRSVTDQILEGDGGAIAKLLHFHLGVDFNLGVGIVGLLKSDPSIILDSILRMSKDLKLDPDINVLIGHIVVEKLNPSSLKGRAQGAIILAFKTILRKAFPKFPLETLDMLLKIVVEMDLESLEVVFDKLGIPKSLIRLTMA